MIDHYNDTRITVCSSRCSSNSTAFHIVCSELLGRNTRPTLLQTAAGETSSTTEHHRHDHHDSGPGLDTSELGRRSCGPHSTDFWRDSRHAADDQQTAKEGPLTPQTRKICWTVVMISGSARSLSLADWLVFPPNNSSRTRDKAATGLEK